MPSKRPCTLTAQTGTCRATFAAASPGSPPRTSTSWPPTAMPTSSSRASPRHGGSRTHWGGLRPPSSETCFHSPALEVNTWICTSQKVRRHVQTTVRRHSLVPDWKIFSDINWLFVKNTLTLVSNIESEVNLAKSSVYEQVLLLFPHAWFSC